MGKRGRRKRAGRKRDPDAKRNQTTLEGRTSGPDRGAEIVVRDYRDPEDPGRVIAQWRPLQRLRESLGAYEREGTDFPLDILVSHGLISEHMRDEGLRFAMLSWWLYGTPSASCAALYERMVAGGIGEDYTPRVETETDDDRLKRIASQKARFERMTKALLEARVLQTVRRICQFLELPSLLESFREKRCAALSDLIEMARLSKGLDRLVALREAEDRYHARLVKALDR